VPEIPSLAAAEVPSPTGELTSSALFGDLNLPPRVDSMAATMMAAPAQLVEPLPAPPRPAPTLPADDELELPRGGGRWTMGRKVVTDPLLETAMPPSRARLGWVAAAGLLVIAAGVAFKLMQREGSVSDASEALPTAAPLAPSSEPA